MPLPFPTFRTILLPAIAVFLNPNPILQAEEKERNIDAISDNAFIIEEAYNQEPGVVQHITTLTRGVDLAVENDARSWNYTFTQEWPLWSQDHQFSYTVPYAFRTGTDGNNGPQDVLLNYRYQLLMESDRQPAISPRLSAILPTGNQNDGLGSDAAGFQLNLPVSKTVTDELRVHFNAGATYLPDVRVRLSDTFSDEGLILRQNAFSVRHDLIGYNLGAGVHYAPFPKLHFLLEGTTTWDHAINGDSGTREETFSGIILPGLRYAVDTPGGVQIVLGLGAPIGLTRDAADYGVLFYLSVEHDFVEKK